MAPGLLALQTGTETAALDAAMNKQVKAALAACLVASSILLSAWKPDPLSRRAAERGIAQACSNAVVGITRIVGIQHTAGEADAWAEFEYINKQGRIQRDAMPLIYDRKASNWVMDLGRIVEAAKMRAESERAAREKGLAEERAKLAAERVKLAEESLPCVFVLKNGESLIGLILPTSANDSGVQVKTAQGEYRNVPWTAFRKSDLELFAKNERMQPFVGP